MTTHLSMPTESIECPLCLGEGKLKRTEVLDRLGVKDFARVAQLSAEEAFRLLLQKQEHSRQNDWARFESELARRTAEIEQRHRDELHTLRAAEQQQAHEIQHANRRVEDTLREMRPNFGNGITNWNLRCPRWLVWASVKNLASRTKCKRGRACA